MREHNAVPPNHLHVFPAGGSFAALRGAAERFHLLHGLGHDLDIPAPVCHRVRSGAFGALVLDLVGDKRKRARLGGKCEKILPGTQYTSHFA